MPENGAAHGEAAVRQQPMEISRGADIPAVPGGAQTGAGRCLKEAVTLWKAHSGAGYGRTCGTVDRAAHVGARLLAGLGGCLGGSMQGQSAPEGLYTMEGTQLETICQLLPKIWRSS